MLGEPIRTLADADKFTVFLKAALKIYYEKNKEYAFIMYKREDIMYKREDGGGEVILGLHPVLKDYWLVIEEIDNEVSLQVLTDNEVASLIYKDSFKNAVIRKGNATVVKMSDLPESIKEEVIRQSKFEELPQELEDHDVILEENLKMLEMLAELDKIE